MRDLSGGQRKLAVLAACLARRPDVLLLDEPEAHLDAGRRELLGGDRPHVRRRRRHRLPRPLPARRDGRGDRRAGRREDHLVARQLLGVYRGARAQAQATAAALRRPAEGDSAARRGDPALQALGQLGRKRTSHQAGPQQTAPDRPHGQGRTPRAGAAQDRPGVPRQGEGRKEGDRTPRRERRLRRGSGTYRGRPYSLARRAPRDSRTQRRRQERAREAPRRHPPPDGGRALGGPIHRHRVPGAERRTATGRFTTRAGAGHQAALRGRGRESCSAASCSATSRSGSR